MWKLESIFVIFQRTLWAAMDKSAEDTLFTYPCPMGYCECMEQENGSSCYYSYDSNDPNNQCSSKRKGMSGNATYIISVM